MSVSVDVQRTEYGIRYVARFAPIAVEWTVPHFIADEDTDTLLAMRVTRLLAEQMEIKARYILDQHFLENKRGVRP